MRTNLASLVNVAAESGRATASSWKAESVGDTVWVWHYDTCMIRLERWTTGWYVRPLDAGWGSVSDKQGIGKILVGCRALNARSYRELYREVV